LKDDSNSLVTNMPHKPQGAAPSLPQHSLAKFQPEWSMHIESHALTPVDSEILPQVSSQACLLSCCTCSLDPDCAQPPAFTVWQRASRGDPNQFTKTALPKHSPVSDLRSKRQTPCLGHPSGRKLQQRIKQQTPHLSHPAGRNPYQRNRIPMLGT